MGICHKSINRIVVEIARYAMMDISSELDHEGAAYLPPGSKTFHTTTLNRWVENKCQLFCYHMGCLRMLLSEQSSLSCPEPMKTLIRRNNGGDKILSNPVS